MTVFSRNACTAMPSKRQRIHLRSIQSESAILTMGQEVVGGSNEGCTSVRDRHGRDVV